MLRVVAGTHFEEQVVESPVLGRVAVEPARIVEFLEPIAGFPTCTRYGLLPYLQRDGREDPAMRWLQAMDAPYHTFIVADPWSVHAEYEPEIADSDARQLENLSPTDASFYGIMTVARRRGELTINLRAPLVVNTHLRLGKQVVLLNGEYTTSHRVCELP